MFLDAAGQPRPEEVARLRARHRRARHGGGAGAGARRNTAPANSRSPTCWRRRSELAQEGFPVEDDLADSLPHARERLARWPSSAAIFLNGGAPLQRRRPAAAIRSRRHAARHRRTGSARVLRRADRRAHRRRGARGRRHHDDRRSEELPRHRARAGARQLSRLRHRFDAAALLRRRLPDRDAQHSGRLRSRQTRPGTEVVAST